MSRRAVPYAHAICNFSPNAVFALNPPASLGVLVSLEAAAWWCLLEAGRSLTAVYPFNAGQLVLGPAAHACCASDSLYDVELNRAIIPTSRLGAGVLPPRAFFLTSCGSSGCVALPVCPSRPFRVLLALLLLFAVLVLSLFALPVIGTHFIWRAGLGGAIVPSLATERASCSRPCPVICGLTASSLVACDGTA